MQYQATPRAQAFARSLRAAMTDAEKRLWSGLRAEQLGFKFRRQHPLGHYIADFACLAPKLIVELDGSQHAAQQVYDAKRDAYLKSQGFAVLRFASNEALRNLDGVRAAILECLEQLKTAPIPAFPQGGKELGSPHPCLPPKGGRSWAAPIPAFPQGGKELGSPHPCLPPRGEGARQAH